MEVKCPKCKTEFEVKSEPQVAAGKARAAKWTFNQRSEAMKKSWANRKKKSEEKTSTP